MTHFPPQNNELTNHGTKGGVATIELIGSESASPSAVTDVSELVAGSQQAYRFSFQAEANFGGPSVHLPDSSTAFRLGGLNQAMTIATWVKYTETTQNPL